MSQPILEIGIGADLSPFEKAIGELRQEIRQLGTSISAAGQQATGGYTRAIGQAGKATDDLSGFISKQRAENRQQNFLFRESQNAIGSVTFAVMALSTATGDQSKSMQTLNKGLVTGYSLYQGLSFAAAGLGIATGGTTTAVIALLAVGASLFTFLDTSAEKAKKAAAAQDEYNARVKDSFEGLSPERTKSELEIEKRMVANAKARLKQLEADRSWGKVNIDNLDALTKGIAQEKAFIAVHEANANALNARSEAQEQAVRVAQREAETTKDATESLKDHTAELAKQLRIMLVGDSLQKGRTFKGRLSLSDAMPFSGETITGDSSGTVALKSITTGRLAVDALIRNKQEEMKIWKQSHEFEMSLLDGLKFGVVAAFDEMLMVHRQAKDAWDAIWIAMQNTVISSLLNIGAQLLQNAVIGQLATAAATAATVASMAAIAASAAPAAYAVSVATFGGAALAGTAAYLTGLATIQAASLIPGLADGGLAYGPMLAMVGDNPGASNNPEVIAPLSSLQSMMIPQTQRIQVFGKLRGRTIYLTGESYQKSITRS